MPEATIKPPDTVIFIFGGSGDLNQRKLTPALYNLFIDGWMPEKFAIIGLGRSEYSDEKFRTHLLEGIQEFSRRKDDQNKVWEKFSQFVSYLQMDAEDAASYSKMSEVVKKYEAEWGAHPNVMFYLAVAPQLVPDIAVKLAKVQEAFKAGLTVSQIVKLTGISLASVKRYRKQIGEGN